MFCLKPVTDILAHVQSTVATVSNFYQPINWVALHAQSVTYLGLPENLQWHCVSEKLVPPIESVETLSFSYSNAISIVFSQSPSQGESSLSSVYLNTTQKNKSWLAVFPWEIQEFNQEFPILSKEGRLKLQNLCSSNDSMILLNRSVPRNQYVFFEGLQGPKYSPYSPCVVLSVVSWWAHIN